MSCKLIQYKHNVVWNFFFFLRIIFSQIVVSKREESGERLTFDWSEKNANGQRDEIETKINPSSVYSDRVGDGIVRGKQSSVETMGSAGLLLRVRWTSGRKGREGKG